jgi:predicted MFS family arabinose efflux permease
VPRRRVRNAGLLPQYREVLREPQVTRLLFTSLVARLPQGMDTLALLLFLVPHVGYGRAGFATGVTVAVGGASNVWLARAVDRYGARRVMVPCAVLFAAAMNALAFSGTSYRGELALCAVAGAVLPPVTSVSRGLWPRLVEESAAQTLFAVEATAQELVYTAGPGLVAVMAAVAGGRSAVAVTGWLGLLGTVAFLSAEVFSASGRVERVATDEVTHGRLRVGRVVPRYAGIGFALTACFAAVEVGVVDFVGGRSASAGSGLLLAIWSIGSLVGGLRFGPTQRAVTDRSLAGWVLAMAASVAVAAAAPGDIGLGVILGVGGVTIAPSMARLYTRLGAVAPDSARTEAFGWLSAAFLVGQALGSAVAGQVVRETGARPTFVVAAALAALGLLLLPGRVRGRPVAS